MGVKSRIAVPREVLCHGEHPPLLQPTRVGEAIVNYILSLFSKTSSANNGIPRIVIDIHHGSKVYVYTYSFALLCHTPPPLCDETEISYIGKSAIAWVTNGIG